ncbi:hypothetical protein M408DRAFT_311410 [Serendipita vermifera MAFF 305830]|uniref:F-box domain-containing protein n=1 Tax=Serendipita vermifera MAFF 305830 TaxID=933852 RepID=A0A0C3B4U5_SERVB|nr:hypothetical protein M408DRAFT_311410 [Serendipita vermifera MAFF 305830]
MSHPVVPVTWREGIDEGLSSSMFTGNPLIFEISMFRGRKSLGYRSGPVLVSSLRDERRWEVSWACPLGEDAVVCIGAGRITGPKGWAGHRLGRQGTPDSTAEEMSSFPSKPVQQDTETRQIGNVTNTFQTEIQAENSPSRQISLFLTPISRLPTELLGYIFEDFVELNQSPWLLTTINRHWRDIALATPVLWAHIYVCGVGDKWFSLKYVDHDVWTVYGSTLIYRGMYKICRTIEEVESMVSRTAAAQLDIKYTNNANVLDQKALAFTITTYSSRIRSLDISSPIHTLSQDLLHLPELPALKQLSLRLLDRKRSQPFATAILLSAPGLESLVMDAGDDLLLGHSLWGSLRVLQLDEKPPCINQLNGTVSMFESLEGETRRSLSHSVVSMTWRGGIDEDASSRMFTGNPLIFEISMFRSWAGHRLGRQDSVFDRPKISGTPDSTAEEMSSFPWKLAQQDTDTKQILRVTSTFQTQIQAESSSSRQTSLFSAPINKLPTELLGYIFEDFVELNQSPWLLTTINKHWRDIALATPALWAHIYVCGTGDKWFSLKYVDHDVWTAYGSTLIYRGMYKICRTIEEVESMVSRAAAAQLDIKYTNNANILDQKALISFISLNFQHSLSYLFVCLIERDPSPLRQQSFSLPLDWNLSEWMRETIFFWDTHSGAH